MRKNTFELRNSVLNRLFSQRVRRPWQNDSKYPDEENGNSVQFSENVVKEQVSRNDEITGQKEDFVSSVEECILCCTPRTQIEMYQSSICSHVACKSCFENYLTIEITESRTEIACPQCNDLLHPNDIRKILEKNLDIITKYEEFMVRRVLLTDPDSRWCPAPDCSYAVVATSCASCPRLICERPGCDMEFCYHCKEEWHPDQTCDSARILRQRNYNSSDLNISPALLNRDDIKPCPRCQVLIVKMDDGSCNHMVCAVCGSEFCWLCMKIITDLHFLSPSGCTFWGKKPWSKKKKLLWQIGTIFGAPIGIGLLALVAIPAVCVGLPLYVGRKIHSKFKNAKKRKQNLSTLGAVLVSIVVSPILAALSVVVGVPILLFYVYGVVPLSLCRAGCSSVYNRSNSQLNICDSVNFNSIDPQNLEDVSRLGGTSIGDISLTILSTNSTNPGTSVVTSNADSNLALAGSILSHKVEVIVDGNLNDDK